MGAVPNHGIDLFGGVPLVYDNHVAGGNPGGMPPPNQGYGQPVGGMGLMGPPMGGYPPMGGMPPMGGAGAPMGGYGLPPQVGGFPGGPGYQDGGLVGGGQAPVQLAPTTTAPPAKVIDEREKAFDFLP